MTRKIVVVLFILLFFLNIVFASYPIVAEEKVTNSGFEVISPQPTPNYLYGGAWRPGGNYALIVGDEGTVLKHDGVDFYDVISINGSMLFDIAWKPDGSYALIGGRYRDTALLRYDGQNFRSLGLSLREIRDIAWKPDGSYALLVSDYELIRYYESGYERIDTGIERAIYGISWKPDGSYALLVGRNGTILRYDGENIERIPNDHDRLLTSIAWKPDGSSALIAGYGGIVLQYDDGILTELTCGGDFDFNSLSWVPDESCALMVGYDNDEGYPLILKFDGNSFSKLPKIYGNKSYNMRFHDIFLKSDDYALIVGSSGKVMKYEDGSLTDLSEGEVDIELNRVAWKPDGSFALILVGDDGYVWKYDGNVIVKFSLPDDIYWGLCDIAWKPDGSYALIVGDGGGIYKYQNDEITILRSSNTEAWRSVAWHPTENYALVIDFYGTVLKYNELVFTPVPGNTSWGMGEAAWKPNGEYALIAGQHGEIWRYDGQYLTKGNVGEDLYLHDIEWKRDGSYAMITGSEDVPNFWTSYVMIYDGTTYQVIRTEERVFQTHISWDIEGETAYILEGSDIVTYNGDDFRDFHLIHWDMNNDMAWKPDGSYALIVGDRGKVIKYGHELSGAIPLLDLDKEAMIYEGPWENNKNDDGNTGQGGQRTPSSDSDDSFPGFIPYIFILMMSIIILTFFYFSFFRKRNEKED